MSQVYFQDVQEGQEIPPLTDKPTSQRLVMWAAASGDFYQIHYDKDFALGNGLPERITHGALKHALLGRLVHQWAGDEGRVKKVACQYRGMDIVNEDVICHGVVKRKYQDGNENLVELELWTETPQGQKTTPGTAVVALPSRGG